MGCTRLPVAVTQCAKVVLEDWDSALRADSGRVNPLGLVALDRNLRPVGEAYQKPIYKWRDVNFVNEYPTNARMKNAPDSFIRSAFVDAVCSSILISHKVLGLTHLRADPRGF